MKDYFFLAFNNLKRRKVRSWLTMLGIFVGIAAVIALISLGQGLQNAIEEQFKILGTDKITIMGKAGNSISPFASEISSKPLTEKDVKLIEEISNVDLVSGLLIKSIEVEFKGQVKDILMSGIDPDKYSKIFEDSYEIYQGRDFKTKDKFKVLLGYNTANKDFDKKIEVGSKLIIQGKEFEVVGVMEKIGSPTDDSSIIITLESLRELTNEKEILSMIFAKIKNGANAADVAKEIETEMKRNRNENLKEEPKTFSVSTSEQLLQTFTNVFGIVQAVLVGIAAISLLVGGIGIMNTMYTSVLERTKEIGTMKAVGAKNSDILLIFLFEAGLLGLVGGIIGIALGIGLSKSVEYIATASLGTNLLKASTSYALIIGALIFSFLIGSISGVLPAIQAAKLKPADALRYE